MSFKSFSVPFSSAERNDFSNFGRGSPTDLFCEIILKPVHWSQRRSHLKVFLFFAPAAILFSGAEQFNNFGRGSPKEHFCKNIMLILGQWSRRCRLRKLLMAERWMDGQKTDNYRSQ